VETWSCEDVALWLTEQIALRQYVNKFKDNHIDGMELKKLTSDRLQKDLGVGKSN